MIIRNGTIRQLFPVSSGSGGVSYDEHGYPVIDKTSPSSGEEEEEVVIPCQWEQATQNRLAASAEGSAYTRLSYRILTEVPITADHILLCDREGNELGRFAIMGKETLFAVGLYRTTV